MSVFKELHAAVLRKSHVRAHASRSKTGKPEFIKEHEDSRVKKAPEKRIRKPSKAEVDAKKPFATTNQETVKLIKELNTAQTLMRRARPGSDLYLKAEARFDEAHAKLRAVAPKDSEAAKGLIPPKPAKKVEDPALKQIDFKAKAEQKKAKDQHKQKVDLAKIQHEQKLELMDKQHKHQKELMVHQSKLQKKTELEGAKKAKKDVAQTTQKAKQQIKEHINKTADMGAERFKKELERLGKEQIKKLEQAKTAKTQGDYGAILSGSKKIPKATKKPSMSKDEAKKVLSDLASKENYNTPKPKNSKPLSVSNPEVYDKAKEAREALGKEPWQRKRDDVKRVIGMPDARHRKYVEQAIKDGKKVPPEVLKDYPDLVPKKATRRMSQAAKEKIGADAAKQAAAANTTAPSPGKRGAISVPIVDPKTRKASTMSIDGIHSKDTPGLFVHKRPESKENTYSVTHIQSGRSLSDWHDGQKEALEYARKVGQENAKGKPDWTQPFEHIMDPQSESHQIHKEAVRLAHQR